jgi:hypothetical protein
MTLGRETLNGSLFEEYKTRIDAAQTTEDLADIIAGVENPADREKVMYAAARRHNLMLTRKVEGILKNNK